MKPESILLVDDNDFALKELVNILKYTGYKNLTSTDNIHNAEQLALSGSFHCIISAWDIENNSGIELLKKIRNNERLVNLPFFLTDSGYTKKKIIKAGLAGVTGLIVTPYDKENLSLKMESVSEIINKPFFEDKAKNLNKGMGLIEKGKYKEAIVALDEVVNSFETAEYYYNIGYINILKENYSDAIPAFQKATQLDSLFAKAFEGLAKSYNALGLTEDAKKYMQIAADIYIEKGKLEDAESIVKDILQISTDSVNIFNSLGVLSRKKGNFETAVKQYKKALKIHPDEIYILYNIGRLYIDMETPENAAPYFKRALVIKPDFHEARKALDAIERRII
jgi:tetratricopeptide (TPR) repeat protein